MTTFTDPRLLERPANPFKADTQFTIQSSATQHGYKVMLYRFLKQQLLDLSDFVEAIHYSEDYAKAWCEISVDCTDVMQLSRLVAPGDWLVLYGPRFSFRKQGQWDAFAEIQRGQITVFTEDVDETGMCHIIAKTPDWMLAKNKIPYRLPAGTLTTRLRWLQGQGFLELEDHLIETAVSLPATRGGKESIWQDILYDLGETNRVEGKKYVLRYYQGKFYLDDTTVQPFKPLFEVGSNIFSYVGTRSIEDMFNEIHVISTTADVLDGVIAGDSGQGSRYIENRLPHFTTFPITQRFGPTNEILDSAYGGYPHFNKGIDYDTPIGTIVEAAVGGLVTVAGDIGDGWGTSVKVRDRDGNTHNYGHLSQVVVAVNDPVARNQLLGYSGSTGNSTGPHLSYDVWDSRGLFFDPAQFVRFVPDERGDPGPTSLELTVVASAIDRESQFFFGRHILLVDEKKASTAAEASFFPSVQAQADYLLSKLKDVQTTAVLQSFSTCGLHHSDQVLIYEPTTDTVGVFFIRSIEHSIVAGDATMKMEVDFKNVAPDEVRDKVKTTAALLQKFFGTGDSLNGLTPADVQGAIDRNAVQ